MNFELDIDQASIVFVGTFQPGTYNPIWLLQNDLISIEDLQGAEINVISKAATEFKLDWCHLTALDKKIGILAQSNAYFELVRDLGINTLSLMEGAHISAMGLNRIMHFRANSEDDLDTFASKLISMEHWRASMTIPKLVGLTVRDMRDDPPGALLVKIERSNRLTFGVYFEVNSHYKNDEKDPKYISRILKSQFSKDMSEALEWVNLLLEKQT